MTNRRRATNSLISPAVTANSHRWAEYTSLGPMAQDLFNQMYGDKAGYVQAPEQTFDKYIIKYDEAGADDAAVRAVGSRMGITIDMSDEYSASDLFIDYVTAHIQYMKSLLPQTRLEQGPPFLNLAQLANGDLPSTEVIMDMDESVFGQWLSQYDIEATPSLFENRLWVLRSLADDSIYDALAASPDACPFNI